MFTVWLLKRLKIGGDFGILWSIVQVNYLEVGDVSPQGFHLRLSPTAFTYGFHLRLSLTVARLGFN
jgi:hypothetical protein